MKRDYVPLFQQICTSARMADLASHSHRLFYVLLLTQCDSWGRVTAEPRALTVLVWAMLGESADATRAAMADLVRVGMIEVHQSHDARWIQIPDWEGKAGSVGKVEKRGRSRYPEPTPESLQTNSGVSSTPAQSPQNQVSSEERRGEEKREEKKRVRVPRVPSFEIPSEIDTPEFREIWATWVQYRIERKDPLTPTGSAQQLRKCAKMGLARTLVALEHTMAMGWQGMREPEARGGFAPASPVKPAAAIRAEIDRAALEREVERRWTERHTTMREMPKFGGGTVMRAVVDGRYPGYEAARRELQEAG